METKKIVFCRTAWMKYYSGLAFDDVATGGGKYVDAHNGDCGEVTNFLDYNDCCYGYVKPTGARLSLEKVEKEAKNKDFIDEVTVIWVAKNPDGSGMKIVGWYENAVMFRHCQYIDDANLSPLGVEGLSYYFTAAAADCYLLNEEQRTFTVPSATAAGKGMGMGQSNIWYAEDPKMKATFIPKVAAFIEDFKKANPGMVLPTEMLLDDLETCVEDKGQTVAQLMKIADEHPGNEVHFLEALYSVNLAVKKERSYRTLMSKANLLNFHMYYDAAKEVYKAALMEKPGDQVCQEEIFFINAVTYKDTEAVFLGEKLWKEFKSERILYAMAKIYADQHSFDQALTYAAFLANSKDKEIKKFKNEIYEYIDDVRKTVQSSNK